MSKKNNATTTSRSSTRVDAQILEFASSNLPLDALAQRAIFFLTAFKDLARNILGLTPGDQEKFVDKIDQVCQHPYPLKYWVLHFCKGIPSCGSAKCKTRSGTGKRVQCNSTASNLSCTLHRTGKTW